MADQPEVTQPTEVRSPGSLLAEGLYAEPQSPEQSPAPAADVPDKPVEDPENPEVKTEGVEAQEDDPEKKAAADGGEGEEEQEIRTIEELSEHFELDPEWLQGLSIKQKVNGKDVEVSLSDALSTHRKVKAADTYLSEAKEKAKAIAGEAGQQKEQLVGAVSAFSTLINEVEAELERDVKATDWAKLREEDPAEFAVRKDEVRERRARVDDLKQRAAASYADLAKNSKQKMSQAMEERLPSEREALLERVPDWGDEQKATAERTELVNYLKSDGFTAEELEVAGYNGKVLALAIKAMRYDKVKSKSNAASKKVNKVPKILKPAPTQTDKSDQKPGKDRVGILYG